MESPCECGIEPSGFINHGVTDMNTENCFHSNGFKTAQSKSKREYSFVEDHVLAALLVNEGTEPSGSISHGVSDMNTENCFHCNGFKTAQK